MFLLHSPVVSWIKFNLDFAGVFYWMLSLKILKGSRKIVQSLHWGAPREIFDFPIIFQWKLDMSKKKFPYTKDYGIFLEKGLSRYMKGIKILVDI